MLQPNRIEAKSQNFIFRPIMELLDAHHIAIMMRVILINFFSWNPFQATKSACTQDIC